eukprot:4834210-Pyramimonas_sp.AAC.1
MAYSSVRYVLFGGLVQGPFFRRARACGGLATSLIGVFATDSFDHIPRPLGLDFDAYVGDLSLSFTGTARSVLRALVEGARALHERVTQ